MKLNTLIYKPRLILDFIEGNRESYTKKQYETIMKRLPYK